MTFAFDRADPHTLSPLDWERELAPVEVLLGLGGDARIVPAGAQARNRYGRRCLPEDGVAAFGSCTASTVSRAGFTAAERRRRALLDQLASDPSAVVYAREVERLRAELRQLLTLPTGVDMVLAASGTDLHLMISQLLASGAAAPPLVLMGEASETGSGAPAALAGRRFGAGAPFPRLVGAAPGEDEPIAGGAACEVVCLGAEPAARTEAEIETRADAAAGAGRRVLMVLTDVSKTGRIAPGLAAALACKRRHPDRIEVLIDACQLRLSPATLAAYLAHDCLVAITGSKFLGGPAFSGALLVPPDAASRLCDRTLPAGLSIHSAQADWPVHWLGAAALEPVANFGLLLRWSAALEELRAFRALPEDEVADFLAGFAAVVCNALEQHRTLEALAQPPLDRPVLSAPASWDRLPSIFTFALRHGPERGGALFDPAETALAHKLLQTDLAGFTEAYAGGLRVELGQPVTRVNAGGQTVSALRLCASAPLIVEALSGGLGARRRVMDRTRAAVAMTASAAHFVSTSGLAP